MATATDLVSYMDRRLTELSAGVSRAYAGGVTTWTLPYSVAVDGSEGALQVCTRDYPQILTCTRPAANQVAATGDYRSSLVYIGVLYPFMYVPTTLYLRDRNGDPDVTGRLLLHRLTVLFNETTDISATVRRAGRPKQIINKSFVRAQAGELVVPIHAKNKDARVEITSTTPGARALTGLVWQGEYQTTNRRV